MLRVIEGGRPDYLSGDEFVEILVGMDTQELREFLAHLRAISPMHKRSPETHRFLLSLAKWIDDREGGE